jgi:glutamine amidotransferase
LSVLRRADGVVLASEPYDDEPGWQEIPDRHLVVVAGNSGPMSPPGRLRIDLIPLKGSP